MTTMEKLTLLFETCHMVYVETNPHHVNYESVTAFVTAGVERHRPPEIVGEVDDDRTLYRVQVYLSTPVGSHVRIGHDLDAVLDSMLEELTA